MIPNTEIIDNVHMIFDPGLISTPGRKIFSVDNLIEQGFVTGQSAGRGTTFFFRYHNRDWVLRHYRRGGMPAKVLNDCYFGFNPENSRPWKEWRLLHKLYMEGFPVPRPVAAQTVMNLGCYRGDLITEHIPATNTLADTLKESSLSCQMWFAIGACLRNFHNAGVYHADLNAQNILIDNDNKVYLIDFDRCSIKNSTWLKRVNLARLNRSLEKLRSNSIQFYYHPNDWRSLCSGYSAGDKA